MTEEYDGEELIDPKGWCALNWQNKMNLD